jgi:pentatricopeptide repeat protein
MRRDRSERGNDQSSSGGSQLLELESLFSDWSKSLRLAKEDPQALRPMVELVDDLVRYNHQIHSELLSDRLSSCVSCSPSDEMLAMFVGMSSWARISAAYPDAAHRAQDLFELLPVPILATLPGDVQSTFVRHRRNLYHALLLAWSRHPAHPTAEDRSSYWLSAMQREESKYRYHNRLVNVHVYNRVMGAYAGAGRIKEVERLWSEMLETGVQPNAVSYDGWIKAYQNASSSPGEAKTGGNIHHDQSLRSRAEEIFRGQLEQYRSRKDRRESCKPLPLTLARVLFFFGDRPDEALSLLEAAWDFERDHPECQGLVNTTHVGLVLKAFTAKDRVEEAEDLLARMVQRYEDDSNDHLSPTKKAFGIVMDGFAQRRQSPDSLNKVGAILTRLEDLLTKGKLPTPTGESEQVDAAMYNILMTAYLRAWPDDAVVSIRSILDRMERIAKGLNKPELLPNNISYVILMNALIRRGAPGYEDEVESILESSRRESREAARPDMHSYAAALDAWAKSDDPRACSKALSILDSIESPSTACFNIVLNAYARRGLVDDAVQMLNQMEKDFESGRNQKCQPDGITYSVVLHAKAKHGPVDDAIEILKWMKHKVESGGNQNCQPNHINYLAVLHALSANTRESTHHRFKKALACFDDMSELFRRGNARCRPSQETITALLQVLRTCDDVTAKHVAAREVLERLGRLSIPQGPVAALSFILASGETKGPYDARFESMQFILSLLDSLSAEQLTPEIYRAVLKSCHNLLFDRIEEKKRLIEDVFERCTRTGHVSLRLLRTLFKISPPDLYSTITHLDAGKALNVRDVPERWKRNTNVH